MKNIHLLIFASIFISFSIKCKISQVEINPINNLNSIEKKKEFLTNLFKADQKLKQGQDSKIMIEYGYKSKEHIAFIKKMKTQDSLNLIKAEQYLNLYGYPDLEQVGEIPASAIWTVVYHSGEYEVLHRNFPYIYQGYLDEDIDEGELTFYLEGMYQIEFGERFYYEGMYELKYGEPMYPQGAYYSQEKIDKLIKVLKLTTP